MTALLDRSYRLARDGRRVVCDTVAGADELQALRAALAWRRHALSAAALQDADAILALRALIALEDQLADATVAGHAAPLELDREQARMLCEVAGAYVAGRDVAGYQSPEERGRIACLRTLSGPLMDCCCELAAAEREAAQKALTA